MNQTMLKLQITRKILMITSAALVFNQYIFCMFSVQNNGAVNQDVIVSVMLFDSATKTWGPIQSVGTVKVNETNSFTIEPQAQYNINDPSNSSSATTWISEKNLPTTTMQVNGASKLSSVPTQISVTAPTINPPTFNTGSPVNIVNNTFMPVPTQAPKSSKSSGLVNLKTSRRGA